MDALGTDVFARRDDDVYFHQRIPNGMRTGLIPTSGGALSESWTYGYDVVSNITSITKPAGVENYGYDALDRLNAYTLPTQAQVAYSYDFDGNRLSETQSGVTVNHTYGTTSNRQLTAVGAMIGYDANGNRSSDTGGSRTFSYDVRNRLRQATADGQAVGTYTINALGQRVRKVAGSSDVDFVYDRSGKLIGEYANGAQIREYVYLDNLPVAQIAANGAITYLHPDHLGTPRSATNANAQIVWRWDSDPFGKATPNQDPDGDLTTVTVNLRFPGQYFDMETGLNYNYFRDYDAGVGRYVQSDPIGLAGGLNTFAYSVGNPLSDIDPLGLDTLNCIRPLSFSRGLIVGPFYHEFLCVVDSGDSQATCGGLGPSGGMAGSPAIVEPDTPNSSCKSVSKNNRNFDQCVLETLSQPANGWYDVRAGRGLGESPYAQNCQTYTVDVIARCSKWDMR